MRDTGPLKLRARDREDLQAISVCLQDALVPISEMAFLRAEKRFVLIANRFRWERGEIAPSSPGGEPASAAGAEPAGDADFLAEDDMGPLYERVNCAVIFDGVRNVRVRGLDLRRRERILNLLALRAEPAALLLIFAGGGVIHLKVSAIRCHLEDLGEPWPTRWRPRHDGESGGTPPSAGET